jgi:hypothetical protein
MKGITLVLVFLAPAITAFAQVSPPMVGDKPLVQVAPRSATPAPSLIDRLRVCLNIEDQSKERLDCYDGIVPPQPKPSPPPATVVTDCKFQKEQDARLACFNRFVERPAKRSAPAVKQVALPKPAVPVPTYTPPASTKKHYVRRGRGGCGSRGGAGYRLPSGKCASRR